MLNPNFFFVEAVLQRGSFTYTGLMTDHVSKFYFPKLLLLLVHFSHVRHSNFMTATKLYSYIHFFK